MVEFRLVESRHVELPAVVLEMATYAVRRSASHKRGAGMVSPFGLQSFSDFDMAVQALKAFFPEAEIMAAGALGRSFEILVGARQRSWRDLCRRLAGEYERQRSHSKPIIQQTHAF